MNNIAETYKFKVVTNSEGQRVMIVGDDYRHFNYEAVPFDDFDAIFFETEDYAVLKRQVMSLISVENSPNYSFKGLFFKPAISNKTSLVYADGICTSIDSQELIQETRRLRERFLSLHFKVYDREPTFWTPERRIFHVIRTYLLRSDDFPERKVQKLSALGYAIPRLEMLLKYKFSTVKTQMQYLIKLCDQHKLLTRRELAAVVHVCPKCYENRLLLQEVCPKCGSLDIDEVNMIHHFRCANISAEESYIQDGKLICPKCRHELKHIGVDYDRPASMYYCRENGVHFATPLIKALCASCNKTSDLSQLIKRKLHQLDYTVLGRTMFAQYDHVQDNDNVPKLPSIHSYTSFIYAVKVRVNIALTNGDLYPTIFRLRITPEDNYEVIDNVVIHRIYGLYPNAVISYKNNTFYLLHSFTHKVTEDIVNEILPLKEFNRNNPGYTFDGDYIELDINRDIDSIIASL